MMGLMTKLSKERRQTLVIVTHDMEIASFSNRIVRIRDGKIESTEIVQGA